MQSVWSYSTQFLKLTMTPRRANKEVSSVVPEFLIRIMIHRSAQRHRRVKNFLLSGLYFCPLGSQLSLLPPQSDRAEKEGQPHGKQTSRLSSARGLKGQGRAFFVDTSAVTSPLACEPRDQHKCHHHCTGQVELELGTRLRDTYTPQHQPLLFNSWD